MSEFPRRGTRRLVVQWIGMASLGAFLMGAAMQQARAYIDPNAAGPLYQLLFPLLIALSSVITGLRARLVAIWNRVFGARQSRMSAESNGSGPQQDN